MCQSLAEQAKHVLSLYDLEGEIVSFAPYGDGHINDTYRVTTRRDGCECHYILQHLSPVAFHEPEQVMDNVSCVTAYLKESIARRGGDPDRETLDIIPLRDGKAYLLTDNGCWRMYRFITDSVTYQLPDSTDIFREAGRAFGMFLRDLGDYPASTLHETIPHFHDTVRRVTALEAAVSGDAAGRAAQVTEEIAFVRERAAKAGRLVNALADHTLPLRVTHNDTKLNNVLMDRATRKALCVIDLDTVMPGLCAYDFGDAIRFGANTAAEDEADLSLVHFSLPMFRAYCEGYLGEAGHMMTREEILSLPVGAWMMTYECGVRFLTDYLNGDVYFHTAYLEHNLVRARDQFALLKDMEKQAEAMDSIVREWIKEEKA